MGNFLIICASIEDTIESIYRHFTQSVLCDEILKSIWAKMAEEEAQHAIELRFAARLPVENTIKSEILPREKVEQLLNRAKAILEGIKQGSINEQDALKLSMKLEDEFMEVHIVSAVEFNDGKMKEMFEKIASDEEDHVMALKNYYSERFL